MAIDALRNGGDLLNVFGDFPTLNDPSPRAGLQPALGTHSWASGPTKRSSRDWTRARPTRCRCSTSPRRAPTYSPASTRRPVSPLLTARPASTSTARWSASPTRRRPPTSLSGSELAVSTPLGRKEIDTRRWARQSGPPSHPLPQDAPTRFVRW